MEDEFLVSYEAVTPGVPVLTRDSEQFGILEHVLEVPQLDLFDGIVVWVGGGAFVDRQIQKELTKGHQSAARGLERGRCRAGCASSTPTRSPRSPPVMSGATWTTSEVGLLPPPDGAPVYHVNMLGETGPALHDRIGRMFRRPHWTRE